MGSPESIVSFKDFIPLITTLITIVAGYYYLSAQARKNRQVKWVDDFIKEIANFSAVATSISINGMLNTEKSNELLKSVNVLRLYLYPLKNPPQQHKKFVTTLLEVQSILMDIPSPSQSLEKALAFGKKLAELMSLATEVIRIEQGKI
jgi:hypothetical protein